jgi:hypothetical protein
MYHCRYDGHKVRWTEKIGLGEKIVRSYLKIANTHKYKEQYLLFY